MRIRVKAQDHINLDGLTPGELSIIMQGLELIKAKGAEEGNHVTLGFAHNVISEISDALDKVGNIIQGPAKEARKKRKLEEAQALREKSGVNSIMERCRAELASLESDEEDVKDVRELLKEELGREPTDEEIAAHMMPPPDMATVADEADHCG